MLVVVLFHLVMMTFSMSFVKILYVLTPFKQPQIILGIKCRKKSLATWAEFLFELVRVSVLKQIFFFKICTVKLLFLILCSSTVNFKEHLYTRTLVFFSVISVANLGKIFL